MTNFSQQRSAWYAAVDAHPEYRPPVCSCRAGARGTGNEGRGNGHKKNGPDAAYAEISDKSGKFVDRDLYVVVYRLDGRVLAHGANTALIGTDQSDAKDVDGKLFVKERIELAHKQPAFWQAYKFKNPVTGKTEPKQTYCERFEDTAVCAGVYSF